MIELIDIKVKTRHTILNEVTYTFNDNTVYGIVAINGSGKTTLFRTMLNLLSLSKGKILFDGLPVEKRLGQIFYFENVEWLDKNLSGIDYLKFVKASWKSKVDVNKVINDWSMEEYIKIPIKKYSLGMKQRLIIAMYIVSDVKYMIMDEITSGLDEENRALFYNQLNKLKSNKSIILSSHHKEDIMNICDKVLKIENEKLVELIL